jgi:hypothetical protein
MLPALSGRTLYFPYSFDGPRSLEFTLRWISIGNRARTSHNPIRFCKNGQRPATSHVNLASYEAT